MALKEQTWKAGRNFGLAPRHTTLGGTPIWGSTPPRHSAAGGTWLPAALPRHC